MEVRLAKAEEKEQIRAIWAYCFYEEAAYLEWVFGERFQPENTIVAVQGGEVLGALQLIPYTLRIREKLEPCYYIAGVSVRPQNRGEGVASALMIFAEQKAQERSVRYLLLVPALGGYYERFGYVNITAKEEFEFPAEMAATFRFSGNVRKADEPGQLLKLYQDYTSYWDVCISRSEEDMSQILQTYQNDLYGGAYLFLEGVSPAAYLLCRVSQQEINITEYAYRNEAGAKAVLQFIGGHAMQSKKAVLRSAPGDPMFTMLYKTGIRRVLTPSFMAKKIGTAPEKTFQELGAGTGNKMCLIGKKQSESNSIYINMPQWY